MIRDLWLDKSVGWQYFWAKRRERFWLWLLWRVPRNMVYWAGIRLWANASMQDGAPEAPHITMDEALQRWERPT